MGCVETKFEGHKFYFGSRGRFHAQGGQRTGERRGALTVNVLDLNPLRHAPPWWISFVFRNRVRGENKDEENKSPGTLRPRTE